MPTDDLTAAILEKAPTDGYLLSIPAGDAYRAVGEVVAVLRDLGVIHTEIDVREVTLDDMTRHLAALSGKPRYAEPPHGLGHTIVAASSADLNIVARAALGTVAGDPVEMAVVAQYVALLRQHQVKRGIR